MILGGDILLFQYNKCLITLNYKEIIITWRNRPIKNRSLNHYLPHLNLKHLAVFG